MFLNFRIPQATFYEIDKKYSRLQNLAQQIKTDQTLRINQRLSIQSLSNINSDDIQTLLQKGDNDPILPSLTRKQRIIGFMICLSMGLFCMIFSILYIPMIVLKARKFALLFSFGSLFFLSSFSMLWGTINHLKHLTTLDRLPFSVIYLLTLIATIYCSFWIQNSFLTIIFTLSQISVLVWYIISYIPGGSRGLKFFSKLLYTFISKTVSTTLSV